MKKVEANRLNIWIRIQIIWTCFYIECNVPCVFKVMQPNPNVNWKIKYGNLFYLIKLCFGLYDNYQSMLCVSNSSAIIKMKKISNGYDMWKTLPYHRKWINIYRCQVYDNFASQPLGMFHWNVSGKATYWTIPFHSCNSTYLNLQ